MTSRGSSGDANYDYSRIHTTTRSNCSLLCIFIRQVGRLVEEGNSSQSSCRPNAPHIQVLVLPVLTGDFDSGIFLRYSFRWPDAPGEVTDLVGWESSTTQLKNFFRNVERLCYLLSRFHFLSRHESKGRNLVLRSLSGFINQVGGRPPGPRPSVAPAPFEARCLVVPDGNHVRVGTLETLPTACKSNIAPVQTESLGSIARRAFPAKTLLRRGLYHRPLFCPQSRPVASVWRQAICDCSASSLDSVPPWSGECATADSRTSRIVRSASQCSLSSE